MDYAEPSPDDNGNLRWTRRSGEPAVAARASYANINEEAAVQRAFFLSGTVIGLAGGALPSAVQLLYQSLARPHRPRPVPAVTDPSGADAAGTPPDDVATRPGAAGDAVRRRARDRCPDPFPRRRRPRC